MTLATSEGVGDAVDGASAETLVALVPLEANRERDPDDDAVARRRRALILAPPTNVCQPNQSRLRTV
jgi:hypothetical protein